MMRKITYTLLTIALITMNSCSGCVKSTSKKATELSMDALEGVIEAVDEKGGKLSEKGTDAAGSVMEGIGKSLSRQIEANSKEVSESVGKTFVRSLDGLIEGIESEMSKVKANYDTIQCTVDAPKYASLNFIGKQRHVDIMDAYILVAEEGTYKFEFEGYNAAKEVVLSHTATISKSAEDKRKYTLISFGLDHQAKKDFASVVGGKVTIKKN